MRDAVEADGDALGDLADAPAEVMCNVVHDRTVRVAERGTPESDGADGTVDDERPEIVGFVGFDAMPGTVRVTYLQGSRDAREHLLDEPLRFARKEAMDVEVLVPESETTTVEVVEDAGFRRVGTGPRFEGRRTHEYRFDPRRT